MFEYPFIENEVIDFRFQDKLAKEEKSSKFNLHKLQNQWRVIMREGWYFLTFNRT
jgi:hypothetical protein